MISLEPPEPPPGFAPAPLIPTEELQRALRGLQFGAVIPVLRGGRITKIERRIRIQTDSVPTREPTANAGAGSHAPIRPDNGGIGPDRNRGSSR